MIPSTTHSSNITLCKEGGLDVLFHKMNNRVIFTIELYLLGRAILMICKTSQSACSNEGDYLLWRQRASTLFKRCNLQTHECIGSNIVLGS